MHYNINYMDIHKIPTPISIWLDILRALSAQLVLVDHLGLMKYSFIPPVACIAVIVFFLLSGFLIAHTLANHHGGSFLSYAVDRFARIYPAYFATLLFIAIIDRLYIADFSAQYAADGYRYTASKFAVSALFLPKFNFHIGMSIFGTGNHLWTLPIEWWLYMSMGLAFFMYRSRTNIAWKWCALLLFIYFPISYLWKSSVSAIWLLGAGAYILYRNYQPDILDSKLNASMIILILILMMIFGLLYHTTLDPYGFMGGFMLFGCFLLSIWLAPIFIPEGHYIRKMASFFASYSFSLYLTHYSLVVYLVNYKLSPAYLWIFCNLIAIGFAYIFEKNHKTLASHIKLKLAL